MGHYSSYIQLWFSNPYFFAIQCRRPWIFKTINLFCYSFLTLHFRSYFPSLYFTSFPTFLLCTLHPFLLSFFLFYFPFLYSTFFPTFLLCTLLPFLLSFFVLYFLPYFSSLYFTSFSTFLLCTLHPFHTLLLCTLLIFLLSFFQNFPFSLFPIFPYSSSHSSTSPLPLPTI